MLGNAGIRLASLSDARHIAEMSRDHIEQGLRWTWTESRIRKSIRSNEMNVAVVPAESGVSGFGVMEYGDETAHLILLAIQPRLRRKGLGTELVSWLEECARTAGIQRIRVEARADNAAVIAFYRRLAFDKIELIRRCYDTRTDGIRLEKRLWLQMS